MIKKIISTAVISTALLMGASNMAKALDLVCDGAGTLSSGKFGFKPGKNVFGTVVIQNDKITIPSDMLPGVNRLTNVLKKNKKNTFKLKNYKETDKMITANFMLNPANHPSVKIDRYSGVIYVTGLSQTFNGDCSVPEKLSKKF